MELQGKKVAVVGLGVNNADLPAYLLKHGAEVTICDANETLPQDNPALTYQLGKDYLADLSRFDIIFRTPGIPYLTRELQAARQTGVILSSQTDLFLRTFPGKVIGVTGTKGKGTTSSLIYSILAKAKEQGEIEGSVYLAGNIGASPLQFLDTASPSDWTVLELSSFQLQGLEVSPHVAVILNVTIDHLDHHRDEAEYISAKKHIVRYQKPSDVAIMCLDSLTSVLFADETPAQTYFFSRQKSVDQGTFVKTIEGDHQIVLRLSGGEAAICGVSDVQLVGAYNLENVTAAITAAALAGASVESIRSAVTTFTGLPHRLQFVAEIAGVRYYDDSYATVPDATIAAIQSFDQPIVLIVGGSSKNADFTELVEAIAKSTVKTVICIGTEGEKIKQLLEEIGVAVDIQSGQRTMHEIVTVASASAQPGGVVLLSPAAASFGMFRNYGERGDLFQQEVKLLSERQP